MPEGVVHGRSATALTYDFSRTLARTWSPGDEIVVCELDHDSNVRPWVQAAERAGASVRWLRLDPATGELDLSSLDVITSRTRLVAMTAASNLLGTRPPVATVAARAHEVGALVYVDAVHHTAHAAPDIAAMGADLLVCSPYKFFGPHCGALVADPALLETLRPDKLVPSTDAVPERFELGTLPYELLAGVPPRSTSSPRSAPGETRRERLVSAAALVAEHELRLRSGSRKDSPRSATTSRSTRAPPTGPRRSSSRCATACPSTRTTPRQARRAGPGRHVLRLRDLPRPRLPVDSGLRIGLAAYSDDPTSTGCSRGSATSC